ncbi:MAG: hypothetical protein KME15_27720 [Drouetiella hepatica Uher 2000/2452]|jgi:hypothetical protein|uniref:Uncharacterized protein n=1 Tax=Drouetiella hepatica Uher 2000/2452 TaxID=904376 RepID=A0A951USD9_9CYAN|nr:hypothetical protein [Drouetiella hepatica Uher 2000/2452]
MSVKTIKKSIYTSGNRRMIQESGFDPQTIIKDVLQGKVKVVMDKEWVEPSTETEPA